MVLWDKLGGEPPQVWITPEVIMDPPDHEELAAFEADHLARTGAPKAEILAEIVARQERIRALFAPEDKPRQRATARVRPGGTL